ncbi:MAG: aldo/keto reductase [Dehalococcoidales bacterium]|nr:MAG: aldo/keto reductase [Dehalococcoidales bacterium]
MEFRKLGNSGLKVSEVGLGGNNFGWWVDEQTSAVVINSAIDAGINFIDTADVYDQGHSEEYIGRALEGKRHQVIIATKFGGPMGQDPNERGGSRHHVLQAVDNSLKRLQTDYIDLYYMHMPDGSTPIEETLFALDSLVKSGKVRYIGCSNFAAWQVNEALWISKTNHLDTFVVVQQRYNLLSREIERELVSCCKAHGIGVIPYSPLANGLLTGKYRQGQEPPKDSRLSTTVLPGMKRVLDGANWEMLSKLETFAGECGHTLSELAIAWLLAKPWLASVIAGATKVEQVTSNVAATEWKLTAEEVSTVDAITA